MRPELTNLHEDYLNELLNIALTCSSFASFHQAAFTHRWQNDRCRLGRGPEDRGKARHAVLKMLGIRFGAKAAGLEKDLKAIDDDDRLRDLFDRAAECASLGEFRERLSP